MATANRRAFHPTLPCLPFVSKTRPAWAGGYVAHGRADTSRACARGYQSRIGCSVKVEYGPGLSDLDLEPCFTTVRPHPMRGPNRLETRRFFGKRLTAGLDADPGAGTLAGGMVRRGGGVARMADRAGLEFFLPIARWKGFGGVTNSREWSFEEPLTEAAALRRA